MIRFSCVGASLPVVVLTLASLPVQAAVAAPERIFKAGFAERDISPTVGMEQPGGYGKAYHRSFHDPCKVRAAVFDDGKARVAIVGIDALFIRRPTVHSIRTAIQQKCGIEPQSILISASHTHSGGPIGYYLPGEFDDAAPLVRSLVHDRTVCANRSTWRRSRTRLSRPCARRMPPRHRLGAAWATASKIRLRSIDGF